MAKNPAETFIKEIVLGFGFFSGIFAYIGIDPQIELLKVVASLIPNGGIYVWLISVALFAISSILTYVVGGPVGIIAVILAFFGGLFIATNSALGVFLTIAAIGAGYLAIYLKGNSQRLLF